MRQLELTGITWNYSRAFPPLEATAQRFEELHPRVRIRWEKRTLHEFGHASLAELGLRFDLLVVDHPMLGSAVAQDTLLDLGLLLTHDEWKDLEEDAVGQSFESYVYGGKLYALPIDAAAPAASLRPDLLAASHVTPPESWDDLLQLTRRGLVRMPGFPADLFLNFVGLCVSLGSSPTENADALIERSAGLQAMELLRELASMMPGEIYGWNPIALYERLSSTDEFAYCPFAYTYSNYAREGFAAKRLYFDDTVALSAKRPLTTVLGGTGLALSRHCKSPEAALEYSLFVSSRTCQNTLYGMCGGQPARLSAWQNPVLNDLTEGFFLRTLPNLARAYVRPRYAGYIPLQEVAGVPIANYLREGGSAATALDTIDAFYRSSLETDIRHV